MVRIVLYICEIAIAIQYNIRKKKQKMEKRNPSSVLYFDKQTIFKAPRAFGEHGREEIFWFFSKINLWPFVNKASHLNINMWKCLRLQEKLKHVRACCHGQCVCSCEATASYVSMQRVSHPKHFEQYVRLNRILVCGQRLGSACGDAKANFETFVSLD